jgi:hypothetical protein
VIDASTTAVRHNPRMKLTASSSTIIISMPVPYPAGTGTKRTALVCRSSAPGTRRDVMALLQWAAIVGLGTAAAYVLRYDPKSSSGSSASGGDERDVGGDGRAAGT